MSNQQKSIDHTSWRLLKAIYEKTGGRKRGVRDVTELETGLTADEARGAWGALLDLGMIERFSQDYAARLSPEGVAYIESGQVPPEEPKKYLGKVIVRGSDTGARETVAQFVEERRLQAVLLHEQADIMTQVEKHGEVKFAIVLLAPDDLGYTAGGTQELRPKINVLMELGYLIGRLGRAKVCAFAVDPTLDLPLDLAGVALQRLDAAALESLSRELHTLA